MESIYRVTYVLSGVTERTDDFDTMADGTAESAVKAIREKFHGVWGFDPEAVEVKGIIKGHYEQSVVVPRNIPKTVWVFVAD